MVPSRGMAALPYPPINNERTTTMAIKLIANYSKRLGLPGTPPISSRYPSKPKSPTHPNWLQKPNASTAPFRLSSMPRFNRSDSFPMPLMVREVYPARRFLPYVRSHGLMCLHLQIPRPLIPENRHGIVRKSNGKSFYRWHVKTGSMIPRFMIWPYSAAAGASLS